MFVSLFLSMSQVSERRGSPLASGGQFEDGVECVLAARVLGRFAVARLIQA